MRKWLFVLIVFLFVGLIIYYRDHIPTTRSDFINLYYFVFEKKISFNQPVTLPEAGSELNPKPTNSNEAEESNGDNNNETTQKSNNDLAQENTNNNPKQTNDTDIPNLINNYVPFTSQAPYAKWDKLHEEACEEASLAMASYFLEKRELVLSKEAENDIQELSKYAKEIFPNKEDLNVTDLKTVAEKKYNYKNWKIVNNPNTEDIKHILASGKIIIAPMAGRKLGNPNFKQPGPLYHMLIINGYNNKKGVFITQDPGTRKGKNYEYKFEVLLKALHDFPGDKNKIKEGERKILIVS